MFSVEKRLSKLESDVGALTRQVASLLVGGIMNSIVDLDVDFDRVEELETENAKLTVERDTAIKEVAEQGRRIGSLQSEIDRLTAKVVRLENQIMSAVRHYHDDSGPDQMFGALSGD